MPTNASLTFEDGGGMLFEGRISPDRTEAPAGGGGGGVEMPDIPDITEEEVAPEAPPSGTNPIFHNVVEAVRVDDEDGHHLLATVRELPMIKEHVVAGLRYNTDNHTLEWRSSSDLGNEDLEGGAETWTTVLTFVAFDAAEEP